MACRAVRDVLRRGEAAAQFPLILLVDIQMFHRWTRWASSSTMRHPASSLRTGASARSRWGSQPAGARPLRAATAHDEERARCTDQVQVRPTMEKRVRSRALLPSALTAQRAGRQPDRTRTSEWRTAQPPAGTFSPEKPWSPWVPAFRGLRLARTGQPTGPWGGDGGLTSFRGRPQARVTVKRASVSRSCEISDPRVHSLGTPERLDGPRIKFSREQASGVPISEDGAQWPNCACTYDRQSGSGALSARPCIREPASRCASAWRKCASFGGVKADGVWT